MGLLPPIWLVGNLSPSVIVVLHGDGEVLACGGGTMVRRLWLAIAMLLMLAGCRQPMSFSAAVEGELVGEGPLAVDVTGGGVDVPVDPLAISIRIVAATDAVVASDWDFEAESGPEDVMAAIDCPAPNAEALCDAPRTAQGLREGEARTVDLLVRGQDGGELAIGDYVLEGDVRVRSSAAPGGDDTVPMRLRLSLRIREYGGVVDFAEGL